VIAESEAAATLWKLVTLTLATCPRPSLCVNDEVQFNLWKEARKSRSKDRGRLG